MKIHDVENMSAAELGEQYGAIVSALLDGPPPGDLAARYVQARLDAKLRDEKLGEQAKTLEALQTGLAAANQQDLVRIERLGRRTAELADVQAQLEEKEQQATASLARLQSEHDVVNTAARGSLQIADNMIAERDATIALLAERCDRLKTQADLYASVMSTIQKTATDAIATRVIDQADKGE